jgi:hypothetical protein
MPSARPVDVVGVDVGPVEVGAQDGQDKRRADELLDGYRVIGS